MLDGFLKVACATPRVIVADVDKNCEDILRLMRESEKSGAKITVFPELCLTGYTCGDLFFSEYIIKKSIGRARQTGKRNYQDGRTFCGRIAITI